MAKKAKLSEREIERYQIEAAEIRKALCKSEGLLSSQVDYYKRRLGHIGEVLQEDEEQKKEQR